MQKNCRFMQILRRAEPSSLPHLWIKKWRTKRQKKTWLFERIALNEKIPFLECESKRTTITWFKFNRTVIFKGFLYPSTRTTDLIHPMSLKWIIISSDTIGITSTRPLTSRPLATRPQQLVPNNLSPTTHPYLCNKTTCPLHNSHPDNLSFISWDL